MNSFRFCLIGLILLPTVALGGQPSASIDLGMRPESVVRGFDGDLFVTVMNGQLRGDGVIKRIRKDKVTVFTTGLDEPKGIAFVGNYLVCSDLVNLWKIDSFGRKSVLANKSDFPQPVLYLNDVAATPEGDAVYVADMGDRFDMWQEPGVFWPLDSPRAMEMKRVGRIYRVGLDRRIDIVVHPNELMICPNGVAVGKDGQLLIGAFFLGNLLEVRDGQIHVVHSGFRGADGVAQDSAGNYYVSSWNEGKVWKVLPDGASSILAEGLQSAADFLLEEDKGVLYLVDMNAGKLVTIPLQ